MRIPGNFDRWMFNYKEGNLSAEEAAYFESFMLTNPHFADDAEAWENAYVRKESIAYPNANSLIREKSVFTGFRKWAALVLLLITIAGGAGIGNNLLRSSSKVYSTRTSDVNSQLSSYNQYQSLLNNTENEIFSADREALNNSTNAELYSQEIENRASRMGWKASDENDFSHNGSIIDFEQSVYQDYNQFNSASAAKGKLRAKQNKSRKVALNKINGFGSDYAGKYHANPSYDSKKVESDFKKEKTSLLAYRVKKFLNKIDKITGYPIALVNLRDPEILVPNKNILNFNPGFAGSSGNFRMGGDYRNQWSGTSVNSQLSTLYFDSYGSGARGGVGGSITYGQYRNGVYQNMTANLYYSPKFVVGKHLVFEPALKVTMGRDVRNSNVSQNESAVEFNRGRVFDQGIENVTSGRNDSWYKDYGVGFVINTDWFYVGGFVDNMAGHDERIYLPAASKIEISPRLITGVIGFDYQSRNKRTTLSPFLTYYQFGAKKEAWAGATAQFNWLNLGASYSTNREYAASVGLKFKAFKLTYQIDRTESEFLHENFVSHNIGIRFSTPNKTIR